MISKVQTDRQGNIIQQRITEYDTATGKGTGTKG
jgi:hypothetical protein